MSATIRNCHQALGWEKSKSSPSISACATNSAAALMRIWMT